MHDTLLIFLAAGAACPLCFLAGLTWRNRRHERVEMVIDAAICGLDSRVSRIERAVMLSSEE